MGVVYMYLFDKKVVIEYVKEYPKALAFLSKKDRNDKSIVLSAVKSDGNSFLFADDSLKKDYEFAQQCVIENISAINYVDIALLSNIVWCKGVIERNPAAFHILVQANRLVAKNEYLCKCALNDMSNIAYIDRK